MTENNSISLEDQIKSLALKEGADLVGICEAAPLSNKIFSDASFLLKDAQSIISIAISQDQKSIEKYLSKQDRADFCIKADEITQKLRAIGEKIKILLEQEGFNAFNCNINFDYRNANRNPTTYKALDTLVSLIDKEKSGAELSHSEKKTLSALKKMLKIGIRKNPIDFVPEFSHRCAAEAAGLGRIGWSGNLITEKYGARVMLTSVITNATLMPDKPLEKNPCLMCKLCEKACQGGFFDKKEEECIQIANMEEKIGKRKSYSYCAVICGGFIGQNRFKEWSTWSPYRFKSYGLETIDQLPNDDSVDDIYLDIMERAILEGGRKAQNVLKLNRTILVGLHNKPKEDWIPTCANCQIICGPTMQEKKKSLNLLINGGNIEDGDI
ncbi:MAG: hypothetical protein ACTSU4_01725 [Promethearchaeota archaeon]